MSIFRSEFEELGFEFDFHFYLSSLPLFNQNISLSIDGEVLVVFSASALNNPEMRVTESRIYLGKRNIDLWRKRKSQQPQKRPHRDIIRQGEKDEAKQYIINNITTRVHSLIKQLQRQGAL